MKDCQLKVLETYFRLMSLNGAAHIYRTAQNVGIFEALTAGPASASAVAQRCETKEYPTALILDGLCALGAVERDGEGYALASVMQLLTSAYRNLGDQYWESLPQFLNTGTPLLKMDDVGQSERYYRNQAAALELMMTPVAEAASATLDIGGKRKNLMVLDVGAGSAVWSLTFACHDPGIRVTAVDWPAVLEIALRAARRGGLQDRFSTIAGNYHEVELPDNFYHLAILGNVTHLETPQGNFSLFRRLHRSLRPGGEIAIFDVFPGHAVGDLARTLYALGLALRTEHGRVYPPEELKVLLGEAGFQEYTLNNLGVPPYTMGMLLARRPE